MAPGTATGVIVTARLGPLDNNTYLVIDEATGEAAVVDPTFGSDVLLERIRADGWRLTHILLTHGHFDHCAACREFADATGAPVVIHHLDEPLLLDAADHAAFFGFEMQAAPAPSAYLQPGSEVHVGETAIAVRHTPGHSPGHVSLVLGSSVLCGDCLFAGSIGRTDLPGGNHDELIRSIRHELLSLPDETAALPGHGDPTTIGRERTTNPFLQ